MARLLCTAAMYFSCLNSPVPIHWGSAKSGFRMFLLDVGGESEWFTKETESSPCAQASDLGIGR
jgi:hypothetical protein